MAGTSTAALPIRARTNLNGQWQFALDPKDTGKTKGWFRPGNALDRRIAVPGCWQAQGFGDHSVRPPGECDLGVSYRRMKASYEGTAWYKRTFTPPAIPEGGRIWLVLEGVHPSAEIWVNAQFVNSHRGSFVPFRAEITRCLQPGRRNDLTVRVFEKDRSLGGLYNWYANWSGLFNDVYLETTGQIHLENVFVQPDIDRRLALVHLALGPDALPRGQPVEAQVTVRPVGRSGATVTAAARLDPRQATTIAVNIKDLRLWTPEEPNLYTAQVDLHVAGRAVDRQLVRFGMRKVEARGKQVWLNNNPVYLRGAGDDCIFPRTVSPSLDAAYLRRLLTQAKAAGFNYIRHHTHIPHRQYLQAADEVGMLLQVEICHPHQTPDRHTGSLLLDQWRRVIANVRNHPSVITYCMGNEQTSTDTAFVASLDRLYRQAKALDPTRLVLNRAGTLLNNDGHGLTDLVERVPLLPYYGDAVERRDRDIGWAYAPADLADLGRTSAHPCILHEYGHLSSYPDPRLERRYTGIYPYWIRQARRVARRRKTTKLLPTFVRNSQRLQSDCRKIAIERCRAADAVAGFSWWTLRDTAMMTVGVFDDLGGVKDETPESVYRYNGPSVLLISPDRLALRCGEPFVCKVRLSHFTARTIDRGVLEWRLVAGTSTVASGKVRGLKARPFGIRDLGTIRIRPPNLGQARRLQLHLRLRDGDWSITNTWPVWVFPDNRPSPRDLDAAAFLTYFALRQQRAVAAFFGRELDTWSSRPAPRLAVADYVRDDILQYLGGGGRVLLLAQCASFPTVPMLPGGLGTIGDNIPDWGTMGTVIRNHPALRRFPHDGYCDMAFQPLVYRWQDQRALWRGEDSLVMDMEVWPRGIDPIIRAIGSHKTGRKLAHLFEVRVGRGRLLVTNFLFGETIGRCPAAGYLLSELVRYALSPRFVPTTTMSVAQFRRILALKQTATQSGKGQVVTYE